MPSLVAVASVCLLASAWLPHVCRTAEIRRTRQVGVEVVAAERAGDGEQNATATPCFDSEPCKFGIYKKTSSRMYSFVLIPSWCVCSGSQRCLLDRYDSKKKAEIYTCQASAPKGKSSPVQRTSV